VRSTGISLDSLDGSAPAGLGEALTRAKRLVSDQVGLISEVVFKEIAPDEPAVCWAHSTPAEFGPLAGRTALNVGTATSIDPDRAIIKAVGESIERYCCAFYDENDLVLGPFDRLAGEAVPPERYALFSERQYAEPGFPFAPFTRETPVRWVVGYSLLHDRAVSVPASFVFIPYGWAPGEPPLKDQISTGLACGTTYASALLKALGEAVERDAYTIVWRNRLQRPHIDLDSADDPLISGLVNALKRQTMTPHAVLLTVDIPIPVVLIVMTRSDGPPWTIVASGADLSPKRALLLALEEACLAMIGMSRTAAAAEDYRPAADFSDVTTLHRHGLSHAVDPRLRSAVAFLTEPTDVVRLDELQDMSTGCPVTDLRTALAEMREFVSDIVCVDVTTSDVDEVGFKVVRVIVPELQPMDIDHRQPHCGGRRLYDVPVRLGLVSKRRTEAELNPIPHPFP
jgi:ribosomal protein S12 methylthiotransferase accessory factor